MKKSTLIILLTIAILFILFILIPQLGLAPSDAAFRRKEFERHIVPLRDGDLRAVQIMYLKQEIPAMIEITDPGEMGLLLAEVKRIHIIPLTCQLFAGFKPKDASSIRLYFIPKEGRVVRFGFERSRGSSWLSSSMRSRELSDRIGRLIESNKASSKVSAGVLRRDSKNGL